MDTRRLLKLNGNTMSRFRKAIYKATVKRFQHKPVETERSGTVGNVVGFVERLDNGKINGWIAASYPEDSFSINLGDGFMAVSGERFARADVMAAHPEAPVDAGFALSLPASLWDRADQWDLSRLEVKYGEIDIPVLPDMRADLEKNWQFRDHRRALSPTENVELPGTGKAAERQSAVLLQAGLRLSFIRDQIGSLSNVAVQFAGQSYPAQPVKEANADRFFIDLPPFIWDEADEHGTCRINVTIGDTILGSADVSIITGLNMLDLMRLRPDADAPETLLAIEHARYLAKQVDFTGGLRRYLLATADRYNCIDYLCEFFPVADSVETVHAEDFDLVDEAYNEAYNKLVNALYADGQISPAMIADAIAEYGLDNTRGELLFESFVGHFCETGQFDLISDHIDDVRLNELAASGDAYKMTLALPFLAAREQFELATAMLWQLPAAPGWINFECIMVASRHFAKSSRPMSDKAPFIYALLNHIDGLRDQYWSRLYNRNVGGALEPWLAQLVMIPDWLGRDIVDVVLRSLSLSGDFWDFVPDFKRKNMQTVRIDRARTSYETLSTIKQGDLSPDSLLAAIKAARAMRRDGNTDADPLIRELLLHSLSAFSDDRKLFDAVHDEISILDKLESLRVLSHPDGSGYVSPYDAEGVAELVLQASKKKSDQEISEHASLLTMLGRQIYDLVQTAKLEDGDIADLIANAKRLNSRSGGWLAADIMLQVASYIKDDRDMREPLINAAIEAMSDALRDCSAVTDYPAIHAAIARLFADNGGMEIPSVRFLIDAIGRESVRDGGEDIPLNEVFGSISAGQKNTNIPGHCDTLVVIYSCRKYLDDRIPKLRETWISDLKARGIPYVILVGDGDDTLEDDVLYLDVPDTYEALPSKTLKMIEWIYSNTDFQYLVKIDDDCFFSAARFFEAQNYRKANYYGRIILRGDGATNRAWHQAKSDSFLARNRLDRSPEPSRYCDGGSGYSLSRFAMRSVLKVADSASGRWLVSASYFEDKLVGDLLAMAAIQPNNEDYLVHVRRRPGDNQKPVTMFENVYFPSSASPVSLVHLDEAESMHDLHQHNKTETLSPKRIWPTHHTLNLGWNSNQLEYISPADRLERLRRADIAVVAVMRNEIVMLPNFLDHYRSLGVTSFLIADNLSDDGSREFLLAQDDVAVYSVDSEYRESHFGVDWQQALLGNHCVGKWVLVVDADEFLTYPGVKDKALNEITAKLDAAGFDCAEALLLDMYPDGELDDCDFSVAQPFEIACYHDNPPVRPVTGGGVFSNAGQQFTNNLRHRLMPSNQLALFMANKYPLFRYNPMIRLSEGLHSVGNVRISPESLMLAHFKYHREFAQKTETEIRRAQHFGNGIEYKKYRTMLAETQGQLFDTQSSIEIDANLQPRTQVKMSADKKRS